MLLGYGTNPYGVEPYGDPYFPSTLPVLVGYGLDPYGIEPYGNPYLSTELIYEDPVAGATGVDPAATVTFVLLAPQGFDQGTLTVDLAGIPAIVDSVFQPGYAGTITFNGQLCTVVISTHPPMPVSTDVHIAVEDTPGVDYVFDYAFTCIAPTPPSPTVVFVEVPGAATGKGSLIDDMEEVEVEEVVEFEAWVTVEVSTAIVTMSIYVPPVTMTLNQASPMEVIVSQADVVVEVSRADVVVEVSQADVRYDVKNHR